MIYNLYYSLSSSHNSNFNFNSTNDTKRRCRVICEIFNGISYAFTLLHYSLTMCKVSSVDVHSSPYIADYWKLFV